MDWECVSCGSEEIVEVYFFPGVCRLLVVVELLLSALLTFVSETLGSLVVLPRPSLKGRRERRRELKELINDACFTIIACLNPLACFCIPYIPNTSCVIMTHTLL